MKGGKVDEEEGDGKTWAIAYTEKRDGVKPEYDIRTDRFEIAREAMETLEKGIQLSYSDPNSTTGGEKKMKQMKHDSRKAEV